MKKFLFSMLACVLFGASAFAQISTGEPNSNVIPRTGNRPVKGDFGMYIGGSVSQIMDLVDYCKTRGDEGYWGLPVINLKYYMTDRWEMRMGFQFACKLNSTSQDGFKTVKNENYTRFLPGVAYHFNTNNILDVYCGAQIPLGWQASSNKVSYEKNSSKELNGLFVAGAGVFLGLQVFIADLPVAIGVEGGYSGLLKVGTAPVTTATSGGYSQTYSSGKSNGGTKCDATWGADAAITLSYYFHR